MSERPRVGSGVAPERGGVSAEKQSWESHYQRVGQAVQDRTLKMLAESREAHDGQIAQEDVVDLTLWIQKEWRRECEAIRLGKEGSK